MASNNLGKTCAALVSMALLIPVATDLAAQSRGWQPAAGTSQRAAASGDIEIAVRPRRIGLGESAELEVTVRGREGRAPDLQAVDGLQFYERGRSMRATIENGVRRDTVTWHYEVAPQRVGSFTIPAVTATVGGQAQSSAPVQLDVVAGRSVAAAGTSPAGDDSAVGVPGGAFLRVVPSATDTVVGQRVPVEIKAYFPEGVRGSLDRLPALSNTAFTLEKIDEEPTRERARIGDQTYTVLTWHSAVAPVKAGDFALDAELDATLVLPRARPSGRSRHGLSSSPFGSMLGEDPFGDDFFSSFFDRGREERATLRTDAPETLRVQPLPSAGQPAGFDGAVGRFEMTANARERHIAEGDPITLDVTIRGRGNFDRVSAPALSTDRDFRVYPGKSQFRSFDGDSGYAGEKSFVMTVVARSAGVTEIPPLRFSYFDTELGSYETLTTEAISVQVDPAPASEVGSLPAPSDVGRAIAPSGDVDSATEAGALQPIRVEPGQTVRRGEGTWTRSSVVGMTVLALALVGLGLAFDRRRRWLRDPARQSERDVQRALKTALADVDAAVDRDDQRAFADSSRRAVEAALQSGAERSTRMQRILAMTDAVSFGERPMARDEMPRWRAELRAAVNGKEVE